MRSVLNLKPGEMSIIRFIESTSGTCKLLTLGIMPDTRIIYVRKSPFGGALYLKINDHLVAVRESEAEAIKID